MRNFMVYLFILLSSCFTILTAQEFNNDYNILHKEPIEGLKLREAWNSKIPVRNINKVWASWNSIILQTSEENHSIYSIKKESGVVRWINPIGFELEKTPVENINGFYILKENVLYVLDPLQGGLMKKITMNHAVAGNVAASQFSLFSWEWGKKLHMLKTDANFAYGWGHKMDNELYTYATPTIRQSQVYLPTPEGTIYCYDTRGEKVWEFINISVFEDMEYYGRSMDTVDSKISKERQQAAPDLKKIKNLKDQRKSYENATKNTSKRKRGKFLSEPAFYKEVLYVGSTDGSLYAINRFSGNPNWEYQSGEPVVGAIVPLSEQVIFFTEEQGAISIERNADKTKLKWKIKDATEVLNVSEKNIYFRTKHKEILCVDRKFGQEQWRWAIKVNLEVVQDLMDDAIIIVDKTVKDGNITVYALTEMGNLPKVEDVESMPDVGFAFYDEIAKAKEAKIKEEVEKAEKAKADAAKAQNGDANPVDKKGSKAKAEVKPADPDKKDAPAEEKK